MADELLARLAALDTSAVSDAVDRVGRGGVALGLTPVSAGRRIAGRALTVQLGPDDGRENKRHLCSAAVDASGPEHVIVVANDARTDVSSFGGLLAQAARQQKAAGVVIDGVCRDLDEIRAIGLTVYSRGAVPVTARGRVIELAWDVPVHLAGVPVQPSDYILADASGVVVVPAADAAQIVETAEAITRREQQMSAALRAGQPVAQVMGASYEQLARGSSR